VVTLKETGVDKVIVDDVYTYPDRKGSLQVLEDPHDKEFDMAHSDVVGEHEFTCRDLTKPSGSSNIPDRGMVYSNVTVVAQVGRIQVSRLQVHEHGLG
jgi:hypothetical protein